MKLSDFNTLADAKAYTTTEPKLIHRDSMNSLLASAGMYVALKDISQDSTNPHQNLIAAFLDSTEYNFMVGNSTGDRQVLALDSMISAGGAMGVALQSLKPAILSIANPTVKPFESATKHDFDAAKGVIARVSKQAVDGWLKITTAAECESHRPQIYVDVQGVLQRVAGFNAVSAAGDYVAQVPRGYTEYFVDDAYNVVS